MACGRPPARLFGYHGAPSLRPIPCRRAVSLPEVCMILRGILLAAATLAAGAVFAQSSGSTATASQAQAQAQQQQTPPAPLTAADKPNLSYAIGYQIGSDFAERKLDIDLNRSEERRVGKE